MDPAVGATEIPLNLTRVFVGFREEVTLAEIAPALFLRTADGTTFPLHFGQRVPCGSVCYATLLAERLIPETRFQVEIAAGGLQFLDGKPVPSGQFGEFSTGILADDYAPRVEDLTVEVREGCVLIHVAADEVVLATAEVVGKEKTFSFQTDGFALLHDFSWRDPQLPWGETVDTRIHLEDRAGNQVVSKDRSILLPGPIPTLALVELLPNPAGAEATQEWVEIMNFGTMTVELGGLILADKAGSDVLPPASLPAGGRALIVPEGYDPADPKDVPPREGAILVRVSGKLGGDGLSNAGESVSLTHPKGHLISQYGGYFSVSSTGWSGKSLVRKSPEHCDNKAAWSALPESPTPGW
jgi:hypothetical protein